MNALSPLEFRGLLLNEISVKHSGGDRVTQAPSIDFDLWKGESDYKVSISIKVSGPYAIVCKADGFFGFHPGTPEVEVKKLIGLNAPAVLLGALRGILAQTTSCFPSGAYLLPPVNLVELMKSKQRKRSKKKS